MSLLSELKKQNNK